MVVFMYLNTAIIKVMIIQAKKSKKIWVIIAIIFLVCLAVAGVCWILFINKPIQEKTQENSANTDSSNTHSVNDEVSVKTSIVHFAAMGDMLAHDTIIANAKTDSGYKFQKFFANIRPSYQSADVVFCNQEGLSSGEQWGISGYPSFNAPTQFSADLQNGAGCNLINLANNHMGDKGTDAIDATLDVWGKLNPLGVSGANGSVDDQKKISYFTKNGIKFSFLAFADFNNNANTPSYAINIYHDKALVESLVSEARANSDVVIVSMHWGVEDSTSVSDDQLSAADMLNKLGVDVVIGTGPHVLQMMQTVYRTTDNFKTVVWYSLGNMLSSQLNVNELIGGIVNFDIKKDENNLITIDNYTFIPTYMHYEWTATEAANYDLLARKNAMIYLLDNSVEPLSRSLLNKTVTELKQYVVNTIGTEVTVK